MSDERIRPVSGDIIVRDDLAGSARPSRPGDDVVDAEFETLRAAPSERMVPSPLTASIGTVDIPSQGLHSLRKNEVAPPRQSSRGGPLFWIVGLALAAGAFWVSGGHALVRQTPLMPPAPQTEPANPLRIADVTSRVEEHGGRSVLFIDGKAINEGRVEKLLPPIGINVTANDGGVTRYRLGTSDQPLAAGGEFSFSSRFEAPKEGVKSVSVTFLEG